MAEPHPQIRRLERLMARLSQGEPLSDALREQLECAILAAEPLGASAAVSLDRARAVLEADDPAPNSNLPL